MGIDSPRAGSRKCRINAMPHQNKSLGLGRGLDISYCGFSYQSGIGGTGGTTGGGGVGSAGSSGGGGGGGGIVGSTGKIAGFSRLSMTSRRGLKNDMTGHSFREDVRNPRGRSVHGERYPQSHYLMAGMNRCQANIRHFLNLLRKNLNVHKTGVFPIQTLTPVTLLCQCFAICYGG